MASTSQSIRFGGPATATGGGNLEALNRVVADLCTRDNPKVFCFLNFFQLLVNSREKKEKKDSSECFLFNRDENLGKRKRIR